MPAVGKVKTGNHIVERKKTIAENNFELTLCENLIRECLQPMQAPIKKALITIRKSSAL